MAGFNINETERKTMERLKDFQKATVERIDWLFRHRQNRVLVADEVGMGKTLVARGAIVKTARLRIEEGDKLLKVVYICSNASIANQNIQKLKVSDTAKIEGVSDTRLSMQHLKIKEQESDKSLREGFIQLIPLTPNTSFRMTRGGGTVQERALMFAVLSRLDKLKLYRNKLEKMLTGRAKNAWNGWARDEYAGKVEACETNTKGEYPKCVIDKLCTNHKDIIDELVQAMKGDEEFRSGDLLNRLRMTFAKISTEMLEPDLVIMDEFQRFKFLLNADENSDTGMLARKFLEGNGNTTRILLLSATPYKLYSTLDEIDDDRQDEPYSEFLQVMDFLFDSDDKAGQMKFRKVWSGYSGSLREMSAGNSTMLLASKKEAEEAMYGGVCRTERISVMESGDYTDDAGTKQPVAVTGEDILSYTEAGKLLRDIGSGTSLPLDYVKSCPYLLSFMSQYKEKRLIEKYFKEHPGEADKANKYPLWIDFNKVNKYKKLPATNARLEKLREVAFCNHAELFLWVPPSKPYYALAGAYKNSANFSKVLVFSAWEMVPRMIGALISYEAERLTVGELVKNRSSDNKYRSKKRYPYPRLQFSLSNGEPQRMNLLCLLYPSETLTNLYNPVRSLNDRQTLEATETQIKAALRARLEELKPYQKTGTGLEDTRWYYLAPMLMDGADRVRNWISDVRENTGRDAGEDNEEAGVNRGVDTLYAYLDRCEGEINKGEELELGPMPDDLCDTLANMVLGSPAVCIHRANGRIPAYATALARLFVAYFNSPESTAIVELAVERYHKRNADDNTHWQDVLLYCRDGCFQAMFDEYYHLISESVSFSDDDKRDERIQNIMLNNLGMRTVSYKVDTFKNFKDRIQKNKSGNNLMRAHYAVGFVSDDSDEKKIGRKENVRGAFNSPLKPFVLASTSIGQEGLDFHNYCRKIVHWNLPFNPIDLEQREGRINRFKCLAIRQNVAAAYGDIKFENDIWGEMFEAAEKEKKEGQSDLVPFWCFGEKQEVKIERIVPMYPLSKDEVTYDRLIKILSLYRLTLGHPRQEELLNHIFKENIESDKLKEFFIDLSPFSRKQTKKD